MRTLLFSLLLLLAGPALAGPINETGGVAIKGYDPVAYFTDGKAVKGAAQFQHAWGGAAWHFASAEHRDAFAADPQKYAPRYGGFCAFGVAQGYKVQIDPEAWSIVDGVLYLNYSPSVKRDWLKDTRGYITRADANWPGLEAK
jgi:YHS domain-containing protein